MKTAMSSALPVRLPINVVVDLRNQAKKAQRSLTQEIRYRVIDSWDRLPQNEKTDPKTE